MGWAWPPEKSLNSKRGARVGTIPRIELGGFANRDNRAADNGSFLDSAEEHGIIVGAENRLDLIRPFSPLAYFIK